MVRLLELLPGCVQAHSLRGVSAAVRLKNVSGTVGVIRYEIRGFGGENHVATIAADHGLRAISVGQRIAQADGNLLDRMRLQVDHVYPRGFLH